MLEELRAEVCRANVALAEHDLAKLTWGNVSGIDRQRGLVAIKPSGVSYDDLEPDDIVVVDLEGRRVKGQLRSSSDTPTHLRLYRAFPEIGGITHTHSRYATMFAQARRPIACLGTTHADHFHGPVPVTRPLSATEVEKDYEGCTGDVIVECFAGRDPTAMPAVLVAGHAPFTWGKNTADALKNAVALEAVAEMALGTMQLAPEAAELELYVLEKHYRRKHGADAYYGQQRGGDSA